MAILWRGDREARDREISEKSRLFHVFEALSALDIRVGKAVYSEEFEDEVREQLLDIDTQSLPVIWQADFLYGPKTAFG